MKFLLDESAEFRIAAFLRALGHDVTAIAHDYPHALTDREVLAIARREERILITNDRDFGELIVKEQLPHTGVIYLRLPAATAQLKAKRLTEVLTTHRDQLRQLLVVDETQVRVRHTTTRSHLD
jgi:predicted nuclease of predicted toxin-antitoxin system